MAIAWRMWELFWLSVAGDVKLSVFPHGNLKAERIGYLMFKQLY